LKTEKIYDVAIIGGGLAGLSLSIQLAKGGYSVVLFEKETYPFHKVCGEYISFESWNFLQELGIPLSDWNLPFIKKLQISAPGGKSIEQDLPQGGFGISRFKLDSSLAAIAKATGVTVYEQTKITDVVYDPKRSVIYGAENGSCYARLVCGTFGKRSNLDVKWKRSFTRAKKNKLNNFVGVKYHIKLDIPADQISLHNFKDGYCGISRIEDNTCCLCYLTTAANLQANGNSIAGLEKQILRRNPFLDKIFSQAQFLYDQPLTISQISFRKKSQVKDHILFVGDAGGMVTPLCGNGMSMALHGSLIAFDVIVPFLNNKIDRHEMEQQYVDNWNRQFGRRLRIGRIIQRFFGSPVLTNLLLASLKPFPKFINWLIGQTHGKPF
jgi:flavin-dependent dehydrogenase